MHLKGEGVLPKYGSKLPYSDKPGCTIIHRRGDGGDPTSLVLVANAILDGEIDIANFDFQVEDDPPLEALGSEKGKDSSFLFLKPLKAPRLRNKKK